VDSVGRLLAASSEGRGIAEVVQRTLQLMASQRLFPGNALSLSVRDQTLLASPLRWVGGCMVLITILLHHHDDDDDVVMLLDPPPPPSHLSPSFDDCRR